MRHRLKRRVFDCQKLRTSSTTFTNKSLHSKSTYFYRWCSGLVIPSLCASALLFGGVVALCPQSDFVYADEVTPRDTAPAISIAFNDDASFTGPATVNEVSYITNTFTVNANRQSGYIIKLSAMNGSSTELHGKDNYGAIINGVGTNVSPSNFQTNTWGYAIASTDTNPDKTTLTYNSMPPYDTPKNIVEQSLTGIEGESKTYLLSFAAKMGDNSPADHYVGNFILSVVGEQFNPETYTLTYDANNGTNPPSPQSCTQPSPNQPCSITISSTQPTRDGYEFLGWADSSNATEKQYSAGDTITLSASKPIYAVWQANIFNGITTMQAMTSTICTNAEIGEEAKLEDTRDGKIYYVTKLADNNCWMTQNLAYGKTSDTSIGTPCTLSGTSCSGWNNSYTEKYFAIGSHTDSSHTSRGNYYNWQAAIQGTSGGTSIQGVCPSGWQLPISNASTTTNKSFNKLTAVYNANNDPTGSTIMRDKPIYFQYSGYIAGGSLSDSGISSQYWSSTIDSTSSAHNLYLTASYASPSSSLNRVFGASVRCVAK